jgi:hypothetical protein
LRIRVLRRMHGSKRDQITGEWRRIHNGELNDFYSSPNIVRVIKSRRMRLEGHVARMGERRGGCIGSWWGNRRERDHSEDATVDGRIILKWIFKEAGCGGVDYIGLRIGTGSGHL